MPPTGDASRKLLSPAVPFGRYLLLERLGRGGMAEVFRAVPRDQPDLDASVAIKMVRAEHADDAQFVHMFVDEARIASRLNHPNLCFVMDFGCEEKLYYQTLPYLPGVDLHDLTRSGSGRRALPPGIAAFVGREVALGLEHAHRLADDDGRAMHLVHRDVNPRNIRITFDGRVVLLDFGVARSTERLTQTREGLVKGKLSYLAPEQILDPARMDGRADLFALGITLYEMVTGAHPFAHRDVRVMFDRICRGSYRPLEHVRPDLPAGLRHVIERALQPEPEQRWQTAAELAFELRRYLRAGGMTADRQELSELVADEFADRLDAEIDVELRLRAQLEEGARPEPVDPAGTSLHEHAVTDDGMVGNIDISMMDAEIDLLACDSPPTVALEVSEELLDACRADSEPPTRPVPPRPRRDQVPGEPTRRVRDDDAGRSGDWAIRFEPSPSDELIVDVDEVSGPTGR